MKPKSRRDTCKINQGQLARMIQVRLSVHLNPFKLNLEIKQKYFNLTWILVSQDKISCRRG